MDNMPHVFDFLNPSEDEVRINRMPAITIVSLIFFSIVLGAAIGIMHNSCKEKSLFVFRELDVRTVTGGESKRFVGGVLVTFYILWVLIVTAGFSVGYMFYNEYA